MAVGENDRQEGWQAEESRHILASAKMQKKCLLVKEKSWIFINTVFYIFVHIRAFFFVNI